MKTCSTRSHLATAPTNARPGSEEKVRVLAERARMGVALWHPLDARLPADADPSDAVDSEIPAGFCLAS